MNKEIIKAKLRPYYYPLFDFILDKSVRLSERKMFAKSRGGGMEIWKFLLSLFKFAPYRVLDNKSYCSLYNGDYSLLNNGVKGKAVGIIKDPDSAPEIYDVTIDDYYVAKYHNLVVRGGSDCVLDVTNEVVISDYANSIDTKIYANPRGVIRIQHNKCALIEIRAIINEISKGLMILTPGANNLYHCIFDCMMKLFVINKFLILPDYPLLLDESLTKIPQLMEVFNLLVPNNREVVWIKNNQTFKIKDLAYIPSVNFIPFQVKDFSSIKLTDFRFNTTLLSEFRDYLLPFQSEEKYPRKIFLSRKGYSRRSYNENELMEVIWRHGFEIVHPENLSYRQQMSLFHGADIIIGPTGAAFTNILFCKPSCTSVCLMGVDINLPIFTAGAYVSKSRLVYLIGEFTGKNLRYKIQSPYRIDPNRLDKLLSNIENNEYS